MQDIFIGVVGNLAALVTLSTSLVAFFKAISWPFSRRKMRYRADYKFARQVFAKDKWEQEHDYLIECGYRGITSKLAEAPTIKFFMGRPFPLKQLTDYGYGEMFLSVDINGDNKVESVGYKQFLSTPTRIKVMSRGLATLYFMFAILASIPLIFLSVILKMGSSWIALGFMDLVLAGTLTYFCLDLIWSLQAAKRVVGRLEQLREPEEEQAMEK